MSYEILSNDLYKEDDKPKRDKKKKVKHYELDETKDKSFSINPMYIHIFLLVIIILGIVYYFSSNLNFNSETNTSKIISIVGELNEFNKSFNGNIELNSNEFKLVTNLGSFDDKDKDFIINNFNGSMKSGENNSIILIGNANNISFGNNLLKLNGEKFKLISSKKTNIKLIFPNIKLNFNNGRIMVDEILNYEFDNSSIELNNYNCSINYDGIFSFSGTADNFILNSNNNIMIKYK